MQMRTSTSGSRAPVRDLEKRIDELSGLLRRPILEEEGSLQEPENVARLALSLADQVEKGHRQLIESNIELLSLREVAHRLLSVRSADRAAETIARYVHKVLGFERVAVLLLERDRHRLTGFSICRSDSSTGTRTIQLPLLDASGAIVDVLLHGESRRLEELSPPHLYRGEGDLESVFDLNGVGGVALVPLRAGSTELPCHEEKQCTNRHCPVFRFRPVEPCWLQPHVDCRHEARFGQESRRATCLGCSVFPHLGVIMAARRGPDTLPPEDLPRIESVAGTLAAVVENANLYRDLKQGELFRDDLLNSMGSGLVAVDTAQRSLSVNRTAVQLTGWDRSDVIGRVPPFFSTGDRGMEAAIRGALNGRPVIRKEALIARKDGATFPASLSTAPLRNARGEIYGAIVTFLDLTDFKAMEERIRQLDRLAALGRFTAAIAHEIRNPLAGISAGVEYLRKDLGHDGPDENIQFILTEIQRLNRIVEDLFRVTHPHPLMTAPESPEAILERALRSLGALPEERRIAIERHFRPDVPAVHVDADQIQQVAINLIKNALEAMEPGGTLTLATGTRPGRAGEDDWVTLKVTDTGPGMTEEVRKRLFEPFFTRKASGTGLGLYISHGIVERHGGHLRVDSREGAGSTFTVDLPRQPVSNGGAS